ncbi:MAG: transcription antitermination factor NusB [Actinomycetes bacterium]
MAAPREPSGAAPRRPPRQRHPDTRRVQTPADPARRAAYELLRAVATRDAYANLALPAILRDLRVVARDAAFATELGYGTLRGRGTYDAVLAACVDRPLDALDPPVLDLLRLGAHQLLAMRVPSHAAVATTVDLARATVGAGASRLVNAVLRRVADRDRDAWLAAVAPPLGRDPAAHLAVVHSHPRWIVAAVRAALGGDLVETAAALAADNEPAAVTLAARPGRGTRAELVDHGAEPTPYSAWGATLSSGDPGGLEAVAQGRAQVQDEGSQLVALALAAVPVEGAERVWLDVAAGPGGKAALLQGIAAERGIGYLAADRAPHRAGLVRAALAGAPGRWLVAAADGRSPWTAERSVDRVLLDAPCSGLGALRRRPEARWRRLAGDLPELTRLQRDLLGNALDAVRAGGVVAYVTCSPHPVETRQVVDAVIGPRDDVELVDARPFLPGVPHLGPGPDVQLWPHRHGTDAMYLALVRRR